MSTVIEAQNLTKKYGEQLAVDDVSFRVCEGEVFGFLGPNGGGKTTSQRMLTGVLPPTEGKTMVLGHDMLTHPVAAKEQIGVVPEIANPYMDMSGWRNMVFAGELYGLPGRRIRSRAEELLRLFKLWERRHDIAKHYSKGMKQRLILAMSLIHEPRVLFLDEPTAGLDVESRRMIHRRVTDLAEEGMAVFYTTHDIEEANVLCDRVGIIYGGKLVALDTPEALKSTFAGNQSVVVSFESAVDMTEMESLDGVSEAEKQGDKVRLFVSSPGRVVQSVARFAHEHGLEILSVNTLGPSLEEVFLSLSSDSSSGRSRPGG